MYKFSYFPLQFVLLQLNQCSIEHEKIRAFFIVALLLSQKRDSLTHKQQILQYLNKSYSCFLSCILNETKIAFKWFVVVVFVLVATSKFGVFFCSSSNFNMLNFKRDSHYKYDFRIIKNISFLFSYKLIKSKKVLRNKNRNLPKKTRKFIPSLFYF